MTSRERLLTTLQHKEPDLPYGLCGSHVTCPRPRRRLRLQHRPQHPERRPPENILAMRQALAEYGVY